MATISRRKLLARTGMGVAAAGVVTAVPGFLAAHHGSRATALASNQVSHTASAGSTAGAEVPSVAYIRDAGKGEIVLMVGTREVVHTDPALVAYLARAYSQPSA